MTRKVRLKEVCREITVGHVGPMADQYVEYGIPFLRSQNIEPFRLEESNIKFIGKDFHNRLKKSALSPGDVLVVRTGYPGTACVLPESMPVANCADLVIIRPSDEIDSYFLCCLFNSVWGQGKVAGSLVGVAQQHFNVGAAKDMEISLPSLHTQKQVASILSAYDDLIENNTRRIKILEEMAQMIYREWFEKFRFPDHKKVGLATGETGNARGGWQSVRFGDVAEVTDYVANGSFASLKANVVYRDRGGFAILVRTKDYGSGWSGPFVYVDEHGYTFLKKTALTPGDLVISNVGNVGTVFAVPDLGQPMTLGPNAVLVRCVKGKKYLFHYLRGASGQQVIRGITSGSAQPKFNKTELRNSLIPFPPISLLDDFNVAVNPIEQLADLLRQKNRLLRQTCDLLLPKLISGEVSVKHFEAEAVAQTV